MLLSFWVTIILFSLGRGENVSSLVQKMIENESSTIDTLADSTMAQSNKPSAVAKLVDRITDIVKRDITTSLRDEYGKALTQNMAQLTAQLIALQRRIDHVPKAPKWPSGSYCILANGDCPAGFTQSSGYMKAVAQYAPTGTYIKAATFGSSKIQCHGNCGKHGQWIGDLTLTARCK